MEGASALDVMDRVFDVLRPCSERVGQKFFIVAGLSDEKLAKLAEMGFKFKEVKNGMLFKGRHLEIFLANREVGSRQ